ncbi:MAG: hypothetical protein R3C45_11250 [Phycisphaerales bacterium]
MQAIGSVVSHVKLWGVTATVAAVAAVQPAFAEVPAALSQAPQDAQLVFIVPSMSQFSGKLAMLNQNLGLDIPELADALGTFKAETGIGDAMNDAGSAMMVIHDLAGAIDTGEEPDILLILPVTDYAAFIASFQEEGAAPAGAGVTQVTMPDGQAGFARESGGYAILGNKEDAVANFTPGGDAGVIGGRVGSLGAKCLGECDAAVYIDLEALAPTLIPKIDQGIAEINKNMSDAAEMGMMDPAGLEMMNATMSLYAVAGKAVLNSAEGIVFALDISEHGVGITKAANFKADSPVMKYLPGGGGNTASILARLPQSSYIAAAAIDTKAIAITELFEAAMEALPQDNPQMDLYRKSLPMMKQIQQYAGVLYTPDPGALMSGTGAINMLQTYKVDDGTAYMKSAKECITSMNGVEIPMAMPMAPGGQPPVMTYATSYTDNALQLDGVQVDQYSMQMNMPQEMLMQMGPAAGFMTMFTNFNGYAAQTDGYFLSTTTLDQQLMAKGLATGKTGDGLGAGDTLATVREKAIPDGAVAEVYISLGGITETVGPMAMMFGMPAIEAPQDLPPVAIGMGMDGTSTAGRLYVPNDTTRFIIGTVKDMQQQMMGGPGMQQGPGAPPPPF